MSTFAGSPRLKASGDFYLAGVKWSSRDKERGPQQTVIGLSREDAETLAAAGRVERLTAAGGQAAVQPGFARPFTAPRAVLLDAVGGHPRLLLSGPELSVQAMKDELRRMLNKEEGCSVAIHPYDTASLRKPTRKIVEDIERQSGCRLIVEDQQKKRFDDPISTPRQHAVHLLGDADAQARALRLLTPRLQHSPLPADGMAGGCGFLGFSPEMVGPNLQLLDKVILRQRPLLDEKGRSPAQGLVAVGNGQLLPYLIGSFFCLGVRKVNPARKPRGGMRIGITVAMPESPPNTLLTKPRVSWVLGRGFARGPDRQTCKLENANFDDDLKEGEEIGVLVTHAEGDIAVFRRADRFKDWSCIVRWEAKVSAPGCCFALLELAGPLQEVELLSRNPPDSLDRGLDVPALPKRIWPPLPAMDRSNEDELTLLPKHCGRWGWP